MTLRIFDGHCDIWPDVVRFGESLDYRVFEERHRRRFEQGGVAGGIFVMWQDPFQVGNKKNTLLDMVSAMEKELHRNPDTYKVIKRGDDINELEDGGRFSVMIGLEGLSGLEGDLDLVYRLYEKGLRHIGMTWNEANEFATGCGEENDRGITALGRELLKVMEKKQMLLDISHLNRKSTLDVLELWNGPLIASHSNAHALCPVPRNLEDDLIKAIGQKGGLIGINAYKGFVHLDEEMQTSAMLAKHAAHIATLIGSEHLVFGFDFCEFLKDPLGGKMEEKEAVGDESDGNSVKTVVPTCAETHMIIKALQHEGFSRKDLENMAFNNFKRILYSVGV